MIVKNVYDSLEVRQFFQDNPTLLEAALTDHEIDWVKEDRWYIPDGSHYVKITEDDGTLLGYIQFEFATNVTIMCHGYVKPEYWGTGKSLEMDKAFTQYLLDNTNAVSKIAQTPKCCTQVLEFLGRCGFEIIGIIPAGIYWRGKLEDVILTQQFIRGK